MIKGIHHINIVVTDIEYAADFFQLIGFSVFERKDLSGEWIDTVTGLKGVSARYAGLKHPGVDTAVELLQYNTPAGERFYGISKANSIGIRHFAFQVENIEDDIRKLQDYGAEFFGPLQTNPYGKKMIYLKGPEGIIVELAEL